MEASKCILSLFLAISIFHVCLALPSLRVKRQDGQLVLVEENDDVAADKELNPINAEDAAIADLERNKRKLPDATFEAKNALLGFVFGKIDSFLDTKTRVIEQLDRANIEKNKQWDIKSPVPIKDLQTLVTAVVSPKIRSLGNFANDITTGVLTTFTALSGSSGGGNNPNAGLGNVVSKVLGFSGPILQGSAGGASGGPGGNSTPAPGSDEAGY